MQYTRYSNMRILRWMSILLSFFLVLPVFMGGMTVFGYTVLHQTVKTDKDTYAPGDSGSITLSQGFNYGEKYRSRQYIEQANIKVEFGTFHYEGDRILLTEEDQIEGEFEITINFQVPEGTADGSYDVTWYVTSKWWNRWGSGETEWDPFKVGTIVVKSSLQIPGFPWASIITGLVLGLGVAIGTRKSIGGL